MIAFYYGLTGFACVVVLPARACSRASGTSSSSGVAPLIGGLMLARHLRQVVHRPLASRTTPSPATRWFGIGPPLVIAIGFLLMGIVFMLLCWWNSPEFFRGKIETADPEVALDG